nr:zinc finger BED domain-containing protein RICESLEEPER 2 [Tanacetum cinerariifolium]
MLPKMYDEGRHFQIRCASHVLNLIVKDDLDECSDSVNNVRNAVSLLDSTMKTFLVKHGFRKIITYRITKEKPLTKNAIDAMVEKMIGEVKDIMEVLFRMYKESQLVEALLSTQDWIRRERMEINMDKIEDLLNDNTVIKEMVEAIRSYKGKQVMER